jgi:DNA-directed RNA polymerase specialized sigma24 family protein
VTDGRRCRARGSVRGPPARLRAVAYHTLGSPSEADDAVQEAWLRLSRSDSGSIENLGGWLTTVVARVCLDMLQSRREEPVGIHLPGSAVNDSGGIGRGAKADAASVDLAGSQVNQVERALRHATLLHSLVQ